MYPCWGHKDGAAKERSQHDAARFSCVCARERGLLCLGDGQSRSPEETARAVRHKTRGYTPLGGHSLSYSMAGQGERPPADLFERYRIGPFGFADDDYQRSRIDGASCANRIDQSGLTEMGDAARYGLTYLLHRSV